MKHPSWNKAKRWLMWLCGGVIVLCVAAGGFWYWINITPQVKIPTPIMPNPNGYDFFLRAGAAFVKDNKGVDKITNPNSTRRKIKRYPIAAKVAWLKQNARALELLREGLKYPALLPPEANTDAFYPRHHQLTDLALALRVESHVRAERGDWRGAADSILDALKFGDNLLRGGSLSGVSVDVSLSIQESSFPEMLTLLPHLDEVESRKVAKRMEHLYAGRFPYYKMMEMEKRGRQAAMLELMKNKFWRIKTVLELSYPARVIALLQWLDRSYSPPSWLDTAKEFLKYSKVFFISDKTLMKNYTRLMDAYIANGQRAYIKRQPIPNSGDPLTQLYKSVLKKMHWNWTRMDTSAVLKMTVLALRAFRLEKGHYPTSLNELVPQYLKQVPIDPFADDAPLHYQLQGQKYLLWSIGSDGVDNHAAPIINRDRPAAARYRLLDPDSKGDVVAGINVP